MARLHVLGASGAGTTTLGAALADRLGHPHVDADSLFWLPTDPPFTTKRPRDKRQAMLLRLLPVAGQWVFSGSAPEWAKPIEPFYDLVVFLWLDPAVRMERLRRAKRPDTASVSKRAATWRTTTANFSNGRRPTIPPVPSSAA